jgi:hypothetical protein
MTCSVRSYQLDALGIGVGFGGSGPNAIAIDRRAVDIIMIVLIFCVLSE